ncbi:MULTISPECIES: NUDIX hydrolase [unclassified Variovorax]|uniref:NUDIX hydrolase n=1 Tax=unclassified Variovorax TaxID=663243 RepID=UPI003ECF9AAC
MLLDDTLRALIAGRLGGFERQALSAPGSKRAAVALALVEEGFGAALAGLRTPAAWSQDAAVLLTRRPSHMRNHPGQWALPGGSIDGAESPEEAALRELHEEVGLELDEGAILGRLDDFVTRSGFAITPVVVWAGAARALVPSEAEVASIHRIPLTEFMRADAPLLDPIEDSEHPVLRMPVGDTWIAAPTAAFLYQFRELCIAGRTVRVAHFEQPLFARK